MKKTLFASAILVAFAASPALAATSAQEFVDKAAVSGMFEVQSSQLALDRSQDAGIRDFAQEMVDDHSKANEKLKSVAQQEGLNEPAQLDQKHQEMLAKLRDAQQFDPVYVSMQVDGHRKAVDLFQDYSRNGDNAALKTFATDTLPVLKEHLEDITALGSGAQMTK